MFKKLEITQRHTDCSRCNYLGCDWSRVKYGQLLGHWAWTLELSIMNAKKAIKARISRLFELNYREISEVEVSGIDTSDYPDFCDAYIIRAVYKGRKMSEKELDKLNSDPDFIYEAVLEHLY